MNRYFQPWKFIFLLLALYILLADRAGDEQFDAEADELGRSIPADDDRLTEAEVWQQLQAVFP
jgi:hypothetical protein